MALAIALWSMAVAADEPVEFAPPADLRITNVALGAELQDARARTTLKLVYQGLPASPASDEEDEEDEDEEQDEEHPGEPIATVLCSLTPGVIEQAKIDLVLEGGQTYVFDTAGKNTLYISGNYIDQAPSDLPPDDDEILDEDEDAFRLEDVSSDVEVEADALEEDDEDAPALLPPPSPPKAQKPASAKRAREDEPEPEQQLSKKQRKKLNKMKAEAEAAAAAQPAPEKKQEKQEKKPEQGEGKKKKSKKNKGDKAKL